MCGIVGYVGADEALPIVLEGLRRLEYRGYDSAGVAVLTDGLTVRKRAGKLSELEAALVAEPIAGGTTAMGHTRWATHGPPTDDNAHPHLDCSGRVAVIHNGIVENHQELRVSLEKEGHGFVSETDTEVVAHLIEAALDGEHDLTAAVRSVVARLEGAYSLVVLSAAHPGELVGVKVSSPLVVGLGSGETILASDIPAVLERTRVVVPLDEGQIATIWADGVAVTTLDGAPVDVEPITVDWDVTRRAEGRLRLVHAQGDRRAAQGDPRHVGGAHAGRSPGAGRAPDPRRRVARGLEGVRRGVRHRLPLRPRREVRDRALDPPAGRDRDRERVPLPRSGDGPAMR